MTPVIKLHFSKEGEANQPLSNIFSSLWMFLVNVATVNLWSL